MAAAGLSLSEVLLPALEQRRAENLLRTRTIVDGAQGVELNIDGQPWLSFCSNDYLGMAAHPTVRTAMAKSIDRYGVGSGGSHLITGHTAAHQQLEDALAEMTGRESALLFSTGYMANLGAVTALIGRGDTVFSDRLCHASLNDASVLSRANLKRYHHNDITHLDTLLGQVDGGRKLIVTEGVFSMDGDIAPLAAIGDMATRNNAWLMVDDAHGFGVLGATGAGTLEHSEVSRDAVPVLMATLGKAIGVAGAFVAGSRVLIETLVQQARSYTYTTAMPAALADAAHASLKVLGKESWRREQLRDRIQRFRRLAGELDLGLLPSETPIQPIIYLETQAAIRASATLAKAGIKVPAIRPPTVPEGSARLRITLCCDHTDEHIDRLIAALEQTQ